MKHPVLVSTPIGSHNIKSTLNTSSTVSQLPHLDQWELHVMLFFTVLRGSKYGKRQALAAEYKSEGCHIAVAQLSHY
jgi:hypothetical protein